MIDYSVLRGEERLVMELRSLYAGYGYRTYRMSRFEEYDLYAGSKDFLVSGNMITFTDTDGKLMALKPDVTLSIVRSIKDCSKISRICYDENVYRVSGSSGTFREIMQAGLECIGNLSDAELSEVALLAQKSLKTISASSVLTVSHMGIVEGFLKALPEDVRKKASSALEGRNISAMEVLARENGSCTDVLTKLSKLLTLGGTNDQIMACLADMGAEKTSIAELRAIISVLDPDAVRIDFSLPGKMKYYNGIVFRGYVQGVSTPVVSGGQYDKLLQTMGKNARAIGFAVYLDALERFLDEPEAGEAQGRTFINIALPKGRLGEKVYAKFAAAGFGCPGILDDSRKLVFENTEAGVRFFWVKPSDVAVYVERGAADIGVAGKDIIDEYRPDVYEMLDLGMGRCRMCVAALKDFSDDSSLTLRVATKFPNIARRYYSSIGREIDVIHLNGSIELAPVLGMSDVIVDIVETGTTLKENGLEVRETIMPISARVTVNKASFEFKRQLLLDMIYSLGKAVEE